MSIDRKDLRVGLVTTGGSIVTAIGDNWLLYKEEESYTEFREPIDDFCKGCTEKLEDEIVEVELVVSSGGHTYFVDSENRIMPNFNTKTEVIRTGIKKQYNKAKGEFVKGDNNGI